MVRNQLLIFLTIQTSRNEKYRCLGISAGLVEKRDQLSCLVVGGEDFD
jgi:hypothetical protein